MAHCQFMPLAQINTDLHSSISGRWNDCRLIQSSPHQDATGLELFPETLPGLVKDRARTTPHALAMDSYICQWTYTQLERNIYAAARVFRDQGVRPGHRVGICFHLSPWAVVSILATMRLGAAVVPVDPLHPLARRMTMLREADVEKVIVEDSSFVEDLLNCGFLMIELSAIDLVSNKASQSAVINGMEPIPGDDAFIAFTSGSTGKPKGIIQTHEAIVTMSKALASGLHVRPSSRVAQFHPYIFDVAMMEIGMCLATGATLCISKKNDMMLPSPGEVGDQLTKSKITHVTLSPTMLDTIYPKDVPTVRVLSVMGEPLGRLAVQRWASNSERKFYQLWGCTEATILQSITTPITGNHNPRNIGAAFNGICRLWVVEPTDVNKLMADGEPGELVVESRALAKGYLNQPSDTARAFISSSDWMDTASRARLYRTGDLAQREADGTITFLGRQDSQMNYHGERIELGEVDFHLDQVQPNRLLACFSDFHVPSQTMVGFVCGPGTGGQQSEGMQLLLSWDQAGILKSAMQQLTEELVRGGELPEYMVPRFWIPICRRPLTSSGKTDRSYLRKVMQTLSAAQWTEYNVSRGKL